MSRDIFLIFLISFLISGSVSAQDSKLKPNVLFIIYDDLNDYLGVLAVIRRLKLQI